MKFLKFTKERQILDGNFGMEEVTAGTDTKETSSYLGFHQSLLLH
jgi:hypothetical protein